MLYEKGMRGGGSVDHFVILTSPMVLDEASVRFSIFTWHNGRYAVPQAADNGQLHPLTMVDFLKSYYGFIAFKP
jgi:hypothetical protein